MNLKDKIRAAVNNFLNDGSTVENKIIKMAEEEIDDAIETHREELGEKIEEAVGLAIKNLKVDAIIIDSKKIRKLLDGHIESIIEENEDYAVTELLSEKLLEELKETTLLPLLQKVQS